MYNAVLIHLQLFPRRLAILCIRLYQKTLSFEHGPLRYFYRHGFCRFTPSCSQYGLEAIEKYGLIKGGIMTSGRILRCNPWNKGGNDPVN